MQYIIRSSCRGLSKATPAAVMQALRNLVMPVGTPFSVYVTELRLLLANVRSVGHVAPEDGTLQIAIKTGVDDQFAGLSSIFCRSKHACVVIRQWVRVRPRRLNLVGADGNSVCANGPRIVRAETDRAREIAAVSWPPSR